MILIGPISSRPITSAGAGNNVTTTPYKATFSSFSGSTLYDWNAEDGPEADYSSYLKTYFIVGDDAMTWMQSPYIYVFLNGSGSQQTVINDSGEVVVDSNGSEVVTDTVSCFMNAVWDWNDSEDEDDVKVSRDIQVYRFREGYLNTVSKNKIRGRGKVLQLNFRSEEGKDFNLLGWAGWITKNGKY